MTFEDLSIIPEIRKAIIELGFEHPMPVQEKVIPLLLNKENEAQAFIKMQEYWKQQTGITVETGSKNFDQWLKWVGIQPTLRRIFGCSFLPHHDYGRGGRRRT